MAGFKCERKNQRNTLISPCSNKEDAASRRDQSDRKMSSPLCCFSFYYIVTSCGTVQDDLGSEDVG